MIWKRHAFTEGNTEARMDEFGANPQLSGLSLGEAGAKLARRVTDLD